MTTPGGVPNLPQGALTIDTLADKTQDMSTPAMRSRAAERFPNIFNSSTGGSPLNDLTPIGIITQIFSGFNSVVANADPADVEGPEDLPGLLLDFIESLPVVGELIGLLEAILGTYDGDDVVLLEVQTIFAPIRAIVDSLTALSGGLLGSFFPDLLGLLGNPTGMGTGTPGLGSLSSIPILGPIFSLFGGATNATQAGNFFTSILSLFGNPTGILTGTPTLGSSIPILGPIIEAITGSTGSLTDLSSFFDDIPLIGDLVEAITGSTGGLGDLTSFFSDIPLIGDLVAAITGTSGGLGDLTSFFGGLVPLDELVAALTGSSGDLADLTAWVNDIPILGDLVAALTGGSGGLLDLASWANALVPLNLFNDLLSGLGGSFGDSISDIIDRLDDFLTPASPIAGGNIFGEILDDVIPGISGSGGLLAGIIGALTGHAPASPSQTAAANALSAQNAALQGLAAKAALLSTAFTSGVSTFDDFERTSTSDLGANWSLAYSSGPGNISTDGHNAAWKAAALTASTRTVRARFTGANASSSTDYQRVEVVLNTAPQDPLIGSPAANDILLRIDSGFTNYIRVRFRGDGICLISRVVSGTETVMNSATMPFDMAGGVTLTAEAGKLGTARYFRGLINGSEACAVTEAGTASLVGSSYRGWGLGMFAGAKTDLVFIPAQSLPGSLKQWTAADQTL